MFLLWARIMGASMEGSTLYFGEQIFDLPLITIGDRTVVDNNLIVGHNTDYGRRTFGRSRVHGLVQEKTFVLANGSTAGREESGPWHTITKVERTSEPPTRRASSLMSMLTRSTFMDLEAGGAAPEDDESESLRKDV